MNAHTEGSFLPLEYQGYVAPFGYDETEYYTSVWGSKFGTEAFAYLGTQGSGVAVVNVTDAANPVTVSVYGADLDVSFTDLRIAGTIGYFSTQSNGTLVVDLATPAVPELLGRITGSNGGFDSVSNAWADGDFLFQVSRDRSAIAVFDVAQPASPRLAHLIETEDSVGVQGISVVDGRLYAAGLGGASGEGATYIYDVVNLENVSPSLIASVATGSNTASAWPASDRTKLFVSEREAGGAATGWDISDPDSAFVIDFANASDLSVNSFSAGELFVLDDYAYTTWHQAGVQVISLDLLDDGIVSRVGAFGTSQASPLEGFVGNTSVYPLDHDRVLLSDTRWGLYVVDATNVVDVPLDLEAVCDGVIAGRKSAGELASALDSLDLLPGDADQNGAVEFGDFLLLARRFGESGDGYGTGDFNCSGEVDFSDFLLLARNFGNSDTNVLTVPEPPTAIPLAAALLVLLVRRNHMQRTG